MDYRDDYSRGRRYRGEGRGWGGPSRGWSESDAEPDREWARQWGYVEGRGRGGQPWHYRERGYREPEWSSPPQRYVGPSWTRESGYGREGWGDPSAWGPEYGAARGGEMFRGPHAGRGPRGYTRSDERIREDVCDRLCDHGFIDASDIDVRVSAGEVTLQGTVRGRQEKRMAEDVAEEVSGVKQVNNELRVSDRAQDTGEQPGRPFRAA